MAIINNGNAVIQLTHNPVTVSIHDNNSINLEVNPNIVQIVGVADQGPAGPQGIQGIQGIPGVAGASYIHDQAIAATLWTVNHNLARFPNVTVIDSANTVISGAEVVYIDSNSITLSFAYAFAGKAYLN